MFLFCLTSLNRYKLQTFKHIQNYSLVHIWVIPTPGHGVRERGMMDYLRRGIGVGGGIIDYTHAAV